MPPATYPEFVDETLYADCAPWPAPEPTRSPYHLTEDQVQFFDENGYLILRQRVTGPLLENLQRAGDKWIQQMLDMDAGKGAPDGVFPGDYAWASRKNGRRVPFRVNYVYDKGDEAAIEFLGSPELLGIAESFCGKNLVPTYESMVFKMAGDGEAIGWHQDACFPRHYRVFNVDVYLDRSTKENGALRVLPRTNVRKQDVCRLIGEHGFDHPDQIIAEMEPGDVLIHDTMVVHGSPQVSGNSLRRTLYYEFRPAEQIEEEGPWDSEWIERRMKLLQLGIKKYAAAYPGRPQFELRSDKRHRPSIDAVDLKVGHTGHTPGSYCSANSK